MFSGLSYGGTWGSLSAVLMTLFPRDVTKIMATLQSFYGIGILLGPAAGAFLFTAGGFVLPFAIAGSVALVAAVLMVTTIPRLSYGKQDMETKDHRFNTITLLTLPSVILPVMELFVAVSGYFMLESMLAIPLKSIGATTNAIGIIFFISGTCFFVSNSVSGYFADKLVYPTILSISGNIGLVIAFIFIGPLPFIHIEPEIDIIRGSFAIIGISTGMVEPSTFTRIHAGAICADFPQNSETYRLVTGLWLSVFFLGGFCGPIVGGLIIDILGFRTTCLICCIVYTIMSIANLWELCYYIKSKRSYQINHKEYINIRN